MLSSLETANWTSRSLLSAAGARKAEMVPLKEVQPLTGYIRGGVTVFGAKKAFPVFADETLELFDLISVSAGQRGITDTPCAPGLPARYRRQGRRADQGPGALVNYLLIHLAKDLRLEWRSKDAINGMLFFALLVVVLFSLAFDPTAAVSRQIAGGILCVATLFAAVTALNQAWTRELRHQVLDAQRMAPAPPSSLFLAKVIANFIFVTVVQIILAPLFAIFYNLHPLGEKWLLVLVLPLGTWALVVNGTFFAALSVHTRNRELLLPLLLFPIFVPALLGMVEAVSAILLGDAEPGLWIKLLAGYDVIFTTVSLLLFSTILNAE